MRIQAFWKPDPDNDGILGNGKLDPIRKCEDGNDNGVIDGTEDLTGNGRLDGDHPVKNEPNNPAYSDSPLLSYVGPDIDNDGHDDEYDYRCRSAAIRRILSPVSGSAGA